VFLTDAAVALHINPFDSTILIRSTHDRFQQKPRLVAEPRLDLARKPKVVLRFSTLLVWLTFVVFVQVCWMRHLQF